MPESVNLVDADLVVDRVYEGGRRGNAGDDPLNALLGVSNQGGFRILGRSDAPRLIVLTTSLADAEWPDSLDHETGRFIYYGDNKKPGSELHGTRRYGNKLLRWVFGAAHSGAEGRHCVPPILVFSSVGTYRDMRFLGLAVPGADGVPLTEDLVAIWKSTGGLRFQNYRAMMTILDVSQISRGWLNSIIDSTKGAVGGPEAWTHWKRTGGFRPLKAARSLKYRTRTEQEPQTNAQKEIIASILGAFSREPVKFERCAGRIAELLLEKVTQIDITRPTRDGGRDAIGRYRIGGATNGVEVEFAVEAKCYSPSVSVGVKELSRLISRLRHRQFGVLVTTSFVAAQAYQEIKDDDHPIIVVSARDIAEILEQNGVAGPTELAEWLSQF